MTCSECGRELVKGFDYHVIGLCVNCATTKPGAPRTPSALDGELDATSTFFSDGGWSGGEPASVIKAQVKPTGQGPATICTDCFEPSETCTCEVKGGRSG